MVTTEGGDLPEVREAEVSPADGEEVGVYGGVDVDVCWGEKKVERGGDGEREFGRDGEEEGIKRSRD